MSRNAKVPRRTWQIWLQAPSRGTGERVTKRARRSQGWYIPCIEMLERRELLANYVVTSVNDSGPGTLRQAIADAITNPGPDTIYFDIPGPGVHTIRPHSALPVIAGEITIDGTTQPGYSGTPVIELDGSDQASGVNGLTIEGANSVVKGLAINQFPADALLVQNSSGNVIVANFIGTDATGTISRPNNVGIRLFNAANNRIGGTTPAELNVISGHKAHGITIQGPGTTHNIIEGNFIGTDVTGTHAIPNVQIGVDIWDWASLNQVGGTDPGAANVISGNGTGVVITYGASNNLIQGNLIGTDVTGTKTVKNFLGVRISEGTRPTTNNLIGGSKPGAGNLISGNGDGIHLYGAGATGNSIQGNLIGTDVNGAKPLGNGWGVFIENSNTTVGGGLAEAKNVISGNGIGVYLTGSGNQIEGNLIGTDVTGMVPLGNQFDGILLMGSNNRVGGEAPRLGNIISGNGRDGVALRDSGATENVIEGNLIGTDATGVRDMGNGEQGVHSLFGASHNTVRHNVIAFNSANGVKVADDAAVSNTLAGNRIHANGALGIDLGGDGVTPNDACDEDAGPNALQNFPVLTAARAGTFTTVAGILNGLPNTSFVVDFFASAVADPAGYGEGERFLGSAIVTTDDSCNAKFKVFLEAPTSPKEAVSATATDASGNTSEFAVTILARRPLAARGVHVDPEILAVARPFSVGSSSTSDIEPCDASGATGMPTVRPIQPPSKLVSRAKGSASSSVKHYRPLPLLHCGWSDEDVLTTYQR